MCMSDLLDRVWRLASRRRRITTAGLAALLVIAGWIGQGVLSVLRQVDDYAAYWERRAEESGEVLYVALGDSAAQAVGATEPWRGYVGVLAAELEESTGRTVRVVNIAVSGARARDVLDEQLPRLESLPSADVLTLAIGGNDAGSTDPQAFRATFAAILEALPDGAIVADLPDFQGGPRLDASRQLSAIAREEILARPRLRFAPLEEATRDNTWLDYAPDFFHPDDSGYQRWADAFRPAALAAAAVD